MGMTHPRMALGVEGAVMGFCELSKGPSKFPSNTSPPQEEITPRVLSPTHPILKMFFENVL